MCRLEKLFSLAIGYLASLIIGRDVALISAVAFYRYRSLPPDEVGNQNLHLQTFIIALLENFGEVL